MCGLSDLALLVSVDLRLWVVLLIIVHGGAYLVLSLEYLDLGVLAPDHQLEGRLLLETVHHALMKVMHSECVLRQEVLDIILESLAVLLLLAILKGFHKRALLLHG